MSKQCFGKFSECTIEMYERCSDKQRNSCRDEEFNDTASGDGNYIILNFSEINESTYLEFD